jgi:VWFA-related protein
MNRLLVMVTGVLLCACSCAVWGQSEVSPQSTPAQAAPTDTTIRSNAQEVVLDMVFRDKKGKTIRDLKPEEIHISEDGVDQKLTSFQLVEGNAPSAPTGEAQLTLDPMREIRLVTLVFEGLDPEGKRFFRQALKDILDTTPEQNLYFSVLTIDQRLHVIQPFTADHNALLKSVDKSAMWSFIQYSNNSAQIKSDLKAVLDQGEPSLGSTSGPGGGGPSQGAIQGAVTYRMAKMQYDMLSAAEAADREYNARATIDALLTLVRAQSQLPGRKVVLYFNPSLTITETVKEQYSELISVANRSNVSFYTVDPRGLASWSNGALGRDPSGMAMTGGGGGGQAMMIDSLKEIQNQQLNGGRGEVSTAQVRAQENAESAMRANPLEWLRDLARQTGGMTIAETNDWRAPLRTVMEEVRSYYEAAYTPHVAVLDGKFRKISVHVDRPNVIAHTRSGYFALPAVKSGQQLYAYEMPLLNALNASPSPEDLSFQAAAERFNDHGPKVQYMITVEAPLKGLTFAPQPDQKNASLDVALLAVLRNPNGEIVEKFSKDFAVQVPLDTVEARKAGNNNLLQTFSTSLSPGTYTLEAVAMDRNSNKLGTVKSKLVVPEPSNKLSISDVVLVRRTDQAKDAPATDAFYFPGGKVVPTLTDTVKGGPGNVLPFYFTVYPDPSTKEPVKSFTMSFYREGKYLGSSQAPLQAAEPDGRIPYIANLPGDVFTPGAYQIKITVAQGSSSAEQNIDFHVN